MKRRHVLSALLFSGTLASGLCGPAAAQSYPTRPIELVVPTSAGSGTDIYARATAEIVYASPDDAPAKPTLSADTARAAE